MESSFVIKTDYQFLTGFIYVLGGFYLYSFMNKVDYLVFDKSPDTNLYFWASLGILILSIHLTIFYFGRLVLYSKNGINFLKYKEGGSFKGIFFLLFTILVVSHLVYVEDINTPVMIIELFGIILYSNEVYQIHFNKEK